MYVATQATRKLLKLRKRIKCVAGGTSAGKTISILQILIDKAQSDTQPTLTSVVSESFPHLKRGVIRDFKSILQTHNYWQDSRWNATDHTYTFETGSTIEFFSADQPGKARGPRRDRLFGNEVNNWPNGREIWDQLEVRTREEAWADWNPTYEYFMYDIMKERPEDIDFVTLTYLDNEALEPAIVASIEARKANKAWWTVYGLGQLGEVEGRIYKDWAIIDEIPHEAQLVRRGLDWGYSADPAAVVDVYQYNGGYILNERLYRKGLTNKPIADFLNSLENAQVLVMADSSEPKSIAEVKGYGINILGVDKKGDGKKTYLRSSIGYMQEQRISVTSHSLNLIREYRSYMWMFDKDGKQLPEPEPGNDHALDAARYALDGLKPRKVVAPHTPSWVAQRKSQW